MSASPMDSRSFTIASRVRRRRSGAIRRTCASIAVSKTKPRRRDPRGLRRRAARLRRELRAGAHAEGRGARRSRSTCAGTSSGTCRSNKARVVAHAAHMVHTIDGPSLARELGKRFAAEARGVATRRAIARARRGERRRRAAEARRFGRGSWATCSRRSTREPALALRGLMTMPPNDLEAARRAFEALVVAPQRSHGGRARLPELSMGMSDDLEIAIACGATLVRVGTAIFGAR